MIKADSAHPALLMMFVNWANYSIENCLEFFTFCATLCIITYRLHRHLKHCQNVLSSINYRRIRFWMSAILSGREEVHVRWMLVTMDVHIQILHDKGRSQAWGELVECRRKDWRVSHQGRERRGEERGKSSKATREYIVLCLLVSSVFLPCVFVPLSLCFLIIIVSSNMAVVSFPPSNPPAPSTSASSSSSSSTVSLATNFSFIQLLVKYDSLDCHIADWLLLHRMKDDRISRWRDAVLVSWRNLSLE